jgi:hypothetical protein
VLPAHFVALSEPAFLVLYVCSYEVFVRFCQINYALDDADNTGSSASYYAEHELNNSLGRVSEDKLVYTERAYKNPANTRFLSAPIAFQSVIAPGLTACIG